MAQTVFKYSLDRSSRKFICPACEKKRFVRYVDNETGDYLPDDVGRCDREESCGYHKPPREAGLSSYDSLTPKFPLRASKPIRPVYLPYVYVERSIGNYERNRLITWMATLPGWDRFIADRAARIYKVGTWRDWPIFWQIDEKGRVRFGKMLKYGPNGRRAKAGYRADSVHAQLERAGKLKKSNRNQCFYGLHLVDGKKPVAIVESEKTAIIASQYLQGFHWLAAGSLQGINEQKIKPLAGLDVVLFPDSDGFDKWQRKANEFRDTVNIRVSDLLERKRVEPGKDLADYLIQFDLQDFQSKQDAPHGRNPWTGEIFDERGYPKDWDEVF